MNIADCQSVATGVDWETAYKHCRSQNDSLADIHDVQNHDRKTLPTIWSSIKGQFTPWIVYLGCYEESVCKPLTESQVTQKSCLQIKNNTVGNCYFECKSKNYSEGGGAVQTLRIFSLVSRNLCVYVCVVTSNFNLFQTVLNATYRVDRLLITENVVVLGS